ncbi:MAG: hypothetical protein AAGB22_08175 [Bacteroidota bacterium]
MKRTFIKIATISFIVAAPFVAGTALGQPSNGGGPSTGGTPPCWPPPCVPVDGGVGFLVAAGLAFGAKKVLDAKRS